MDIQQALDTIDGSSVLSTTFNDDAPDWVDELRDMVQEQHGYYDRAVEYFIGRSLKRIQSFIQDDEIVRMPPVEPEDVSAEQINQWYDHSEHDRSQYLERGKGAYYDRLSLDTEEGRRRAKTVGMRMEYRDIYKPAYEALVELGVIEEQEKRRNKNRDEVERS